METTFEDRVISEIAEDVPGSRKAALAGLAAIVQCTGHYEHSEDGHSSLVLRSRRREPLIKSFTLIRKTFNISVESDLEKSSSVPQTGNSAGEGENTVSEAKHVQTEELFRYEINGSPAQQLAEMFFRREADGDFLPEGWTVNPRILPDERCVRSFLSDQFLCCGTIHDPSKDYYMAFELQNEDQAQQSAELLKREGIVLHPGEGNRSSVLRTRDSSVMVEILSLVGAHVSMMDLENARIMRQVRSRVNRKVNCETSNIRRTAVASSRQLEEIRMLQNSSAWKTIPESLREIAILREEYPESSLQELGNMLNPPIGKSGVNHRLRRLSAIAEELQKHS